MNGDARLLAGTYGVYALWSWGVIDTNKADESEILLYVLALQEIQVVDLNQPAAGEGEDTQSLTSEFLHNLQSPLLDLWRQRHIVFGAGVGIGEVVGAAILDAFHSTLQKGERGIGALAVDKGGGHALDGRVEGVFGLEVVANRVNFRVLLEFPFRAGVFILAGSSGAEGGARVAEFGGENLEGNLSRVTSTPPTTFLVLANTVNPCQSIGRFGAVTKRT